MENKFKLPFQRCIHTHTNIHISFVKRKRKQFSDVDLFWCTYVHFPCLHKVHYFIVDHYLKGTLWMIVFLFVKLHNSPSPALTTITCNVDWMNKHVQTTCQGNGMVDDLYLFAIVFWITFPGRIFLVSSYLFCETHSMAEVIPTRDFYDIIMIITCWYVRASVWPMYI